MADQFSVMDVVPVESYNIVTGVIPSLKGQPEADWVDTDFNRIIKWEVNVLDENQIDTIGTAWLHDIQENRISVQTAINGLKLALSLRSMNPANRNPLIMQSPRPAVGDADTLMAMRLPDIGSFSSTPFALRTQQTVVGQPQEMPIIPANQQVVQVNVQVPAGADTTAERIKSYCFLATYLMRLLVKGPDNIVAATSNMKNRFGSFYGPTRTVTSFSINVAQATAYREALGSSSLILNTYSHALANTHNNQLLMYDEGEIGVLSYLGFLHFSYSGMHAYTLMMDLKEFTKVSLSTLLSMFHSTIMAPSLMKIAQIVNTLERTVDNPDRNVYFRYCTLWKPHYFSSVRSRQCPHLVCTLSAAWKRLSEGHENSDPDKIPIIGTLSTNMRETLRRAGELIGDALKANMLGGANVSKAYTLAMKEPQRVEEAVENQWDEFAV